MKKVLVLNTLNSTIDKSCCNVFKKVNWFKCKLSSKEYQENTVTEKINNISSRGFVFQDEKVLPHKLFVKNKYYRSSVHGVFRFTDGDSAKYQVYFGPVIEVPSEAFGCMTGCKGHGGKGFGCKKLGCKGHGGKGFGCKKLGCKGLGCSANGGDTQYVNFLNNDKNQKEVQVLNDHFGLRKNFNSERDDYVYKTITQTSLNELIKEHYEEILSQYTRDVERFYQQGMGYIKTVDTPSYEDLFTQAMLFGSTSNDKAMMADLSSFQSTIRLSRFDVWYYPIVKGLLRRIIERIPIINWFFGKKKTFIPTSRLNDSNIAIVENVYEDDFNAVEDEETTAQMKKDAIIGQIPVTLAVKRKLGFWKSIFHNIEYDFHTYMIDAVQG